MKYLKMNGKNHESKQKNTEQVIEIKIIDDFYEKLCIKIEILRQIKWK